MNYARTRIAGRAPVFFAHRYITRPADAGGENHVAVSRAEFAQMQALGLFALDWESHGLNYGLGREIDHWLATGASVVLNGSRAYLSEASRRYPTLCVVLIEVEAGVLRQRLESRGRESPAEIERRIARAQEFQIDHPHLVRVANNTLLADAGDRLAALLSGAAEESQGRFRPSWTDSGRVPLVNSV